MRRSLQILAPAAIVVGLIAWAVAPHRIQYAISALIIAAGFAISAAIIRRPDARRSRQLVLAALWILVVALLLFVLTSCDLQTIGTEMFFLVFLLYFVYGRIFARSSGSGGRNH